MSHRLRGAETAAHVPAVMFPTMTFDGFRAGGAEA
jgi:hypothetical protein